MVLSRLQVRRMPGMKRRGLSLPEVLLAIGIGAIALGYAINKWNKSTANNRITSVTGQVVEIAEAITTIYNSGSFGPSGTDLLERLQTSNQLPSGVEGTPGNYTHVFGGIISATSAGRTFDITVSDIPNDACARIATFQNSSSASAGLFQVVVGSTTVDMPMDESERDSLVAACDADLNEVTWTYR